MTVSQIESADGWRKSTFCGSSSCVEVQYDDTNYLVRDGKNPDGPVLSFTRDEWRAFVSGVNAGEFQLD